LLSLYNMFMFLQVGQGDGAAPAAPATQEGAQQAGEAAQGLGGCTPGGGGMGFEFIIWMVFLFGLMYFLLIRPQKKQRKQHEEMISSLKKGDRVMTTGGILGTIRGISANITTIEIADGVNVRVRKEHISQLQMDPKAEEGKKK
jgi:preprotein translocase subunit YajC